MLPRANNTVMIPEEPFKANNKATPVKRMVVLMLMMVPETNETLVKMLVLQITNTHSRVY